MLLVENQYNKIHNNKEFHLWRFIDSTNIANSSGTLEFGYNIKKLQVINKKTIKPTSYVLL